MTHQLGEKYPTYQLIVNEVGVYGSPDTIQITTSDPDDYLGQAMDALVAQFKALVEAVDGVASVTATRYDETSTTLT